MTVNYTTLLGLAQPVSGTESGTWGDTVNNNLTAYLDDAIAGAQIISGTLTAVTLSKTTGANLSQAGTGSTGSSQYQIIRCTGAPASLLTITAPAANKTYVVINATSTSQSVKIVGAGPTTGVTIASGKTSIVAWNGSDFVEVAPNTISGTLPVANGGTGATSASTARTNLGATTVGANVFTLTNPSAITFPRFNADNTVSALDAASFRTAIGAGSGTGTVTSVSGTGTVNGLTLSGTVTSSGSLTLGGSITGFLPTAGGTMTGAITFAAGQTVDGTNGIGYINIPQNSQSAAYTLVAADAGKHIFHPSTDANARTFTIPANGSVAYPIGTAISFVNMTSQVVSIAITTDTMYLSSAGTTGTRSLAQYGTATAVKITSTSWIISGAGLT
jgi:hypothetical protein